MIRTITLDAGQVLTRELLARSGGVTRDIINAAADIVDNVHTRGDEALHEYTARFDGVELDFLRVTDDEIQDAYEQIDGELITALKYAAERIRMFHSHNLQKNWVVTDADDVVLGQKVSAIRRVGVYVPGGVALYPSSVLMNVIPAQVAGVREIAMVTPPTKDGTAAPMTLVAADILQVREIYKVGGAQAIGALAYGTQTIPAVDKIVGPGNAYVAAAKKLVVGDVGIDMIAGPSEVLIIADETADPTLIAIDLMAQSEHDERAATYLVTTDATLPARVEAELTRLLTQTPRADMTAASLKDNGLFVVCVNMTDAVAATDVIAPEHLEIMTADAPEVADMINNAGAIFIGRWTPESVGDYVAGPNHVLPTGGTARFSSPLTTDDFIKKTSILHYTKEGLARDLTAIEVIAEAEGLWAHGKAATMRFES